MRNEFTVLLAFTVKVSDVRWLPTDVAHYRVLATTSPEALKLAKKAYHRDFGSPPSVLRVEVVAEADAAPYLTDCDRPVLVARVSEPVSADERGGSQ